MLISIIACQHFFNPEFMTIIIIGAGAAGCFAAIEIKKLLPDSTVTIIEKGKRPLAKLAITGGGRCNLTNSFAKVKSMEQVYPRGHRLMKKLFYDFSNVDAYQWFEDNGVELITQDDECVFPVSQDAMEIVNTLLLRIRESKVKILAETKAEHIIKTEEGKYRIVTNRNELYADKILVTTGGHPHISGFDMLRDLNVEIVPPLPSLFSFCLNDDKMKTLMGTVVKDVTVTIQGTKLKAEGALLITHWGISGPAVLKLSSYAARLLGEKNYTSEISIRWLPYSQEEIADILHKMAKANNDRKLTSLYPKEFNARLWEHLLSRSSLRSNMRWKEMKEKDYNRLVNTLLSDVYHMTGKNKFKDEFVTCGGVSLNSLQNDTLEAKEHPGLFFAGEVTDVDAITGGFNLQAAWTMAKVAAQGIAR